MADWFAHRLDAEEIAADRIKRTGFIHVIKHAKAGFVVLKTSRQVARGPIAEIKLPEPGSVTRDSMIGGFNVDTWVKALPNILFLLTDGVPEAQLHAREELTRMAKLADAAITHMKELAR